MNQVQPLLVHQTGYQSDHGDALVHGKPQLRLQGGFVPAFFGQRVAEGLHQIRIVHGIELFIVQPVENTH
ncbi:hypothetical protein D3C72_2382660 [compost metagenome]